MIIDLKTHPIKSFDIRGKCNAGGGCGIARCWANSCGDDGNIAGIYQRKRVGTGSSFWPAKRGGRYGISRMKFYTPAQSPAQIANPMRAVYGAGVGAWWSLTTEEKARYFKQARNLSMSGYNLFMARWFHSRRS